MVSPVQVHKHLPNPCYGQQAVIGATGTEWAHMVPNLEKLALRPGMAQLPPRQTQASPREADEGGGACPMGDLDQYSKEERSDWSFCLEGNFQTEA